ncbi:MAG: virulence RhuM family protein [Sphingobacteriales bacterium]|nr:virulence RhuM family protein [Sphingobacteriales bacterium]
MIRQINFDILCWYVKTHTSRKKGGRKVNREIEYYNLDAIISVGYRVNSLQATQFRKWATSVLREYLVKGFALNDERLKQGSRLINSKMANCNDPFLPGSLLLHHHDVARQ